MALKFLTANKQSKVSSLTRLVLDLEHLRAAKFAPVKEVLCVLWDLYFDIREPDVL